MNKNRTGGDGGGLAGLAGGAGLSGAKENAGALESALMTGSHTGNRSESE